MAAAKIAVVGATGAVGREVLGILMERGFEEEDIKAFASERSQGETVTAGEVEFRVQAFTPDCLEGIDIAFFAAGSEISKQYAAAAAARGTFVIDKASLFRMKPEVPLVVPEVNGDELRQKIRALPKNQGLIIASPNCSTIQLVVILKPILDRAGIRRVVTSTYQSVSGAGQKGLDELSDQVQQLFNQKDLVISKFPHQIAFNCIPHIDDFTSNGYTKEEMKMVDESRKILSKPDLRLSATAVRVPVFCSHSESVNIETEKPLSADEARTLLQQSPGVIVMDNPAERQYPLPVACAGTDATYVGRIRNDISVEEGKGLELWIVADNLRKGAALNAVQIAEIVLQEKFSS